MLIQTLCVNKMAYASGMSFLLISGCESNY